VLVLGKALDHGTDAVIQRTILEELADVRTAMVAHR
jgi:hypothetical protein